MFDNRLRVDIGKWAAIFGYEVMDGVDGRNPNATRALSFTYGPFTQTGVRLTYPINDHLSVTGLTSFGADQVANYSNGLAFGGQINYHPTGDFNFLVNYLYGPNQPNNTGNERSLLELQSSYKIKPTMTVGLDYFTGTEQGIIQQGSTANWNGLAVYWQNDLTKKFSVNLRQEFWNDPQGARLGTPARVRSFTVTPEYRITPNWIYRVDFRFDAADHNVYQHGSVYQNYLRTIFFNQVLKF
jgi:hypothetical protein